MNRILTLVLLLVTPAHAAVFFNETANRNPGEVQLRQNSFGGGHGGSFFYPGSTGYAKWAYGRNEDKGSRLPHGHQQTVRPPPPGMNCDFCAPSTTPGPNPSCFDIETPDYCARVKDVLRSCAEGISPDVCKKTCGFCKQPDSEIST